MKKKNIDFRFKISLMVIALIAMIVALFYNVFTGMREHITERPDIFPWFLRPSTGGIAIGTVLCFFMAIKEKNSKKKLTYLLLGLLLLILFIAEVIDSFFFSIR